jgi:hypothetical protein
MIPNFQLDEEMMSSVSHSIIVVQCNYACLTWVQHSFKVAIDDVWGVKRIISF